MNSSWQGAMAAGAASLILVAACPGHRIRIQISASFFPRFSRNLQTGKLETETVGARSATVTVHHDRERPSRVVLPVVGSLPI